MSAVDTIRHDGVWRVLAEREEQELRFRSAMITSTAVHTGLTLAILLAPLLIPKPQIFEFTPVNLVQLQAPEPAPTPPPAEEQVQADEPEPEPEPEPQEIEPPPPEDVPEDLEAQRIAEEEAAAQRREEERREREAELERQRLAEEARRQRELEEQRRREAEEEARRQPQKAARRTPAPEPQQQVVTQQSQRGAVDLGVEVSEQDLTHLNFWINRVLTNISNNWSQQARPPGSQVIQAVIHFRVDRSGRIIEGPEVRSTSRDRRYDDAALRAVIGGQPFPPLPQAYRGSTLAINLAFRQE